MNGGLSAFFSISLEVKPTAWNTEKKYFLKPTQSKDFLGSLLNRDGQCLQEGHYSAQIF